MDSTLRDYGISRIIDLCKQKQYRQETLHLAINIFDRIMMLNLKVVKPEQLPIYIVACTILAAKLEQPMTPSISIMIRLLPDKEQNIVTKERVILLEEQIVKKLNFNF